MPAPFAQVPTATESQIASLLVSGAALCAITLLVLKLVSEFKSLFGKPPPPPIAPGDEYVRKGEFDIRMAALEGKVQGVSKDLGEKVQTLTDDLRELSDYAHTSIHGVRDAIHALGLQVQAGRLEVRQEIEKGMERLSGRVDKLTVTMARLEALLGPPSWRRNPVQGDEEEA